jgi:hypothetical protein
LCQELTVGGGTSEAGESVLRSDAVQRGLKLVGAAASLLLGIDRTYGGAGLPLGLRGGGHFHRPVELVPKYLEAMGQVGMALAKLCEVTPHVQRLAVEDAAAHLDQLQCPHCPIIGCAFVRSKSQCGSVSGQPGPLAHGVLLVTAAQPAVCHFGQQVYGACQEIGCEIRILLSGH